VQPFERLRHVARWSGDDDATLVSEAADCLAGFADDPPGLVVACRRLLVHHPASGPLWWLCARVLTAPDPARAAWDAWDHVNEDATSERLAGLLPFPHDDAIAVLGWPEVAGAALTERPDLDVVAVRRRSGDERLRARLARRDVGARVVDEVDVMALEPSHLLLEAVAASPTAALVPEGAGDLLDGLSASGAVAWLVAGAGRVLPERLFASLRRQVAALEDPPVVDALELGRFARIAGPHGLDPPDALARRVDCPVAPELLRLGG
jgi:hypothetical protein